MADQTGAVDLEALERLDRARREEPHWNARAIADAAWRAQIDLQWPAILAELERVPELEQYLREKNEIIKAYAGPSCMTPEDVIAALAPAPEIDARAYHDPLTASFNERTKVGELPESDFDPEAPAPGEEGEG